MSSDALGEAALPLQPRVDLAFWGELKDQIERVVVFVMIVQLHDVLVVQLVHDFNFKLDLFDQVMFDDLRLIDHLDGVNIFGTLMSHLVHFSETTDANIGVGKGFEVILPTLALIAILDTR